MVMAWMPARPQATIAEEWDKILGGKVEDLASRCRPDRRPPRGQIGRQSQREVIVAKIFAERRPGQISRRMPDVSSGRGIAGNPRSDDRDRHSKCPSLVLATEWQVSNRQRSGFH